LKLDESLLARVRGIEGVLEVLVDEEDLYVYSREKLFCPRPGVKPSLVVKARPDAASRVVEELGRLGLRPVLRGEARSEGDALVDAYALPDLGELDVEASRIEEERAKVRERVVEEAFKMGVATPRRLTAALKALVEARQVEECSRCEVCSGYCTVAPFYNYVETWTSKGRLLLIHGYEAGELQATSKLVDVVYTCTLCGACFLRCLRGGFPGLETYRAIMAARRDLAERGLAPEAFKAMASNIASAGNPFAAPSDLRWMWLEGVEEVKVAKPASVLLWVGCTTGTRLPEVAVACVELFRMAGVDFAVLGPEEGCCGDPLMLSGMWRDAEAAAAKVVDAVKNGGYQQLVTPCAGCYHAFAVHYPELLGVELPCEVLHLSQMLERLIKEGRLKVGAVEAKVAYHDPCALGRLSGVDEPPRRVLNSVPGLELREPRLAREKSRCCGGGGGLWAYKNQVSMGAAELRMTKDILPLGVDKLVTACPACYMNFKYTALDRSIPIEVVDLAELVLHAAKAVEKA